MKLRRLQKRMMTLGVATVMLITGTSAVFAYSESTEEHTYAGSTRMDCYLEIDNFSAKASLETSDDSELYLWGYVEDALGDELSNRYTFSAGDEWGREISSGRETAFLTTYSYTSYRVDSSDGGTQTSLHLQE